MIQPGVRQLSTDNRSGVMKFFVKSIAPFLDKINTQIWEDFQQLFVTKQGLLASKKYKNYSLG